MNAKIGELEFDNPFIMAPMAGITDSAFRLLCREMGCGLSYSEMISAKAMYYGDKHTEQLLVIRDGEGPVAYQIFGSEPEIMAFAADKLKDRDNCIIDINMGCPVPKVAKNGEGSALMKTPKLIREIVAQTVRAANKPVTVKMRLGWNDSCINVIECAGEAEAGGASAVAVHARTREQYYSGRADWSAIAEVRKNLSIPVIGNGDIFSAEDGLRMMDETGCDMIMVARGALGNPWIFRELNAVWKGMKPEARPGLKEISDAMLRQLNMMAEEKGDYRAVREMRKHVGWYIKGVHGAASIRGQVNTIDDIGELRSFLTMIAC